MGKPEEEIAEMLVEDTWFTTKEAVVVGLADSADEILGDQRKSVENKEEKEELELEMDQHMDHLLAHSLQCEEWEGCGTALSLQP